MRVSPSSIARVSNKNIGRPVKTEFQTNKQGETLFTPPPDSPLGMNCDWLRQAWYSRYPLLKIGLEVGVSHTSDQLHVVEKSPGGFWERFSSLIKNRRASTRASERKHKSKQCGSPSHFMPSLISREDMCWQQQQSFCHHKGKITRKSERLSQNSVIVELLNEAALEFSSPDFLLCEIMNVLTV